MASADLVQAAVRRDADTTPAADGGTHPLYTNEEGRLKVATKPTLFAAVTASITANAQTTSVDVSRASNVTVHIKGGATAGAGGNFTFEGSVDSTNGTDGTWFGIQMARTNANIVETATGTLALAINTGVGYAWEGSVNAYTWMRVRTTAWTSGIYVITIIRGVYATEPIPAIQSHPVTFASAQAVTLTSTTITSEVPGTAATNLGKAEDAVAASGDTGVFMLSVRRDAPLSTSQASAAGDYQEIATDQHGVMWTREKPNATSALTNVTAATTTGTVLALNSARRGATIYNDSTSILYLKLGATASATSFTTKLAAEDYYEVPFGYTGVIDGIWVAANGAARVTEIS